MEYNYILPIENTAYRMNPNVYPYVYINGILLALMKNKEKLKEADYKRLYAEGFDYLYRRDLLKGYNRARENFFKADEWVLYMMRDNFHTHSMETVDAFLEERRKEWNDDSNRLQYFFQKRDDD